MTHSENLKDDKKNEREISISYRSPSPIRQYTAEELAPDGGWGWAVFAGVTLSFIVCFSPVASIGLLFGDFLTEHGKDGSALTTMTVMTSTSFSFTGLFCNELLKKYKAKTIGISGAIIYGIAATLTPLMPTPSYMAITQFFQGIGSGTIVHISNTSMNAYFVKRRAMVFTMSQMFSSLGAICFPFLAKNLLSTYGFRGCMFILAAGSFHTICGMLTLDPVERHYKKPKHVSRKVVRVNYDEEIKKEDNFDDDENIDDAKTNNFTDVENDWKKKRSVESLRGEADNEKPLLIESSKVSGLDLEVGCQRRNSWRGSNSEILTNRISLIAATSMVSMSRVGHQIIELESNKAPKAKRKIASILADFFTISLLRDWNYLNLTLGMTFIFVADGTFLTFLPLILAKDGYTRDEVTLTLTIAATAELASKICLVGFALIYEVKARYVYFGSTCVLFLSRIAFLHCQTFSSMITVITIINLVRSWCLATTSLVLAENFKIEKFAAATGLHIVIMGFIGLLFTPTIGYIKDWTNSYVVVQYILLGIMTLCIVPWSVQIWINDILPRYNKKTIEIETEYPKN